MPRVVKMPRLRCMGRMNSSESNAAAAPTEMASCPMPLNHLEILPWRNWLIIFSSIIRGSMSCE